ncbi:CoxG family protein [Paraburkholderia hospita]|jgi:carbon monoxide dehydrogenase subunit G|uniref:CoxG family protein n=1 Tax=Paraburkholderia hospita TaxID=169430 RepID=UPI00027182FE|nr:carbon monoxide dehydrogenase subunit G [Paraburkholderia hospita]AXE97111.1 carbon monoxide dehydrogenase [Paraburkholderia hospita]EUC21526.1 carbon monoxide dehydrogenase subunit G [Burkholderia sp. BT03]SKC66720.1 Carbon monoxide dehydrogenase subunit G [Burkholderia sp. CF099]SKC95222.1 Carbon monoxide dehydrogenase subunit G [Paraburkholderia hospita]
MELTETYTLLVPQQRAWEALNDMEILRASIPGCDSIEPDGENAYAVALSAAVGPVKARFKGRMELTNIDAPHTYTIVFEGQGGAAGFGKGQTHVTLEPDGDEATTLTYTATAQVGGKLAQIGSRLVDGAARKLAGEFFRRFGEQLTGGSGDVQAESGDSGDTASPVDDGEAAADGSGEEPKRKKSWTAWISKS